MIRRPCPECKMIDRSVRIGAWIDDGGDPWDVIRCDWCGVIRVEPVQHQIEVQP